MDHHYVVGVNTELGPEEWKRDPATFSTNTLPSPVSDQITALSKSSYYHIRELRCIRPCLDSIVWIYPNIHNNIRSNIHILDINYIIFSALEALRNALYKFKTYLLT